MRGAVVIEVNACRNRCLFCRQLRQVTKISDAEIRKISGMVLKHALELRRMGYNELELSGSDPIEFPHIVPLVRLLRTRLGFQRILLSTHGRNLSDRRLVSELQNAGVAEYRIPLYGATADVHEAVTQSRGSFLQTLQGLQNLRAIPNGPSILVTSLLMRQNREQAVDIYRLGATFSRGMVMSLPCIHDIRLGRQFALSFPELRSLTHELLKESAEQACLLAIWDVPFCVIGKFSKMVFNQSSPLPMAASYEVPENFRTERHGFPSYREKQKFDHCKQCDVSRCCDGFFASYLQLFDVSQFKPLNCQSGEGVC